VQTDSQRLLVSEVSNARSRETTRILPTRSLKLQRLQESPGSYRDNIYKASRELILGPVRNSSIHVQQKGPVENKARMGRRASGNGFVLCPNSGTLYLSYINTYGVPKLSPTDCAPVFFLEGPHPVRSKIVTKWNHWKHVYQRRDN
jgi:hypothetical protein